MANLIPMIYLLLVIAASTQNASSARILGVFPHIGKSHFIVFEPLMKELARRGHDVHVISHFPQDFYVANYTDINLSGSVTEFEATGSVSIDLVAGSTIWTSFFMLGYLGAMTCQNVLGFPPVQELLRSDATYDVVITELFNADCFLGFVHRFQAPHVALSSCAVMPWGNWRFGNPDHPAYIPINMGVVSNHMDFRGRLVNTVEYLAMKALDYFVYSRPAEQIAAKYFDKSMPPLDEIAKNTSLMLVNTHGSLNGPRPMAPTVIEVGGLHVKPPKDLPEDLARWMNDASDGVVYFSMGTMLRGDTFPPEKRAALLLAFAKLPQRVLWKWDADSLPGQPANVRVAKWLPQRDILSHPNVRVFMTHCGLLGIIEAVTSGVPMVATPIFGDQHMNCKMIEERGVAVVLPYADITTESVSKALKAVLEDSSYQENAKLLSERYLDRPRSAMDTAVYWIEYVIRNKGAHHLRSAAVELHWYQYLLLDVALVLLVAGITVTYFICVIVRKVCGHLRGICKRDELQRRKHD